MIDLHILPRITTTLVILENSGYIKVSEILLQNLLVIIRFLFELFSF